MFKVEEKDGYYVVIPTAEHLALTFNRYDLPYDTNWEIYKLFNFAPEDLFKFLTITYNATISLYKDFPYASIKFKKHIDALTFCKELERRYELTVEKTS